jgi:hypothetical protein
VTVVTGAAELACVISVIIRRPLPLVLAHRSLHDAECAQNRESPQRPGPAPQASSPGWLEAAGPARRDLIGSCPYAASSQDSEHQLGILWLSVLFHRLMEMAILLAVAASLCTATASICQRKGAMSTETSGFDIGLVFRLARQPVWLLGIASMILGFGFQVTALRFGPLALVQPILAVELLIVFGYLAIVGARRVRVRRRDWLAAAAMSAGIGVFLGLASPSAGRQHAPAGAWMLAGLVTLVVVVVAVWAASGPGRKLRSGRGTSQSRRAALLGAATGISWGFVAAIIKEFSSHLGDGVGAIFTTWSLYTLIAVGAATMVLASHALAAGPLAASQPGFTVLDPLSATLLGEFLFAEHLKTQPVDLVLEAMALAVVVGGASILSHSCLIQGADGNPSCLPVERAGRTRRVLQPMSLPTAKYPSSQSQSLIPNGSSRLPSSPSLSTSAEKRSELSNAERG